MAVTNMSQDCKVARFYMVRPLQPCKIVKAILYEFSDKIYFLFQVNKLLQNMFR